MIRLAVLVLLAGGLVACGDDAACAVGTPTPALRTQGTVPEAPQSYQPPHAWPTKRRAYPRATPSPTEATSRPGRDC